MVTTLADRVARIKGGLARAALGQTVNLAHHSDFFRDWVVRRLAEGLGRSYEELQPHDETLRLQKWFGRSLRPFVCRLIEERPRAARALVRLAYVWAADMKRRATMAPRAAGVSPCTVVIEPTARCNLNCPGCYAKSTRRGEDMSYDMLRATVAEVQAMGVTLVTLSGGEPFMREREERAISRLAHEFPDLGFLVYTNGLLIDEPAADRLGETGNVFPAISIEGGEMESDTRRGRNYYSRTHQVRRLLAERDVMFGFSATVTRQNAALVASEDFIDRRVEEGDFFGWYFILQPIGREPDPHLMVTADQRRWLREQLYRFRAEEKPIFIGDFWNDGQLVEGCIAGGRYYFHIYADGEISPCVFSPVSCGNIHDIVNGESEYDSLGDFVVGHPFFRGFRQKQKQVPDWRAPCLLIDNPQLFRELCQDPHWHPAKNMPPGYLDGPIAQAIDEASQAWKRSLGEQPRVPESVQKAMRRHDEQDRRRDERRRWCLRGMTHAGRA
ncbi:MAG: radical SAM/SPASM domain-containing protein [Candidatus Brocadiia bacterium]